jgi:uncharacterized protein YxjI
MPFANKEYLNAQVFPVPQGLAVFSPEFIVQQPLTLQVHEKFSLSGDDFTAKDAATGALWFKIDGKVMTMHGKKTLQDARGFKVADVCHNIMTMHNRIQVYGANNPDQPLFEASKEWSVKYRKTSAKVTVQNIMDGQVYTVQLLGDFMGKSGIITLGDDHVIAKMHKPTTAKQFITAQHTYMVDIAPGVDASFITLMCVLWDEFARDSSGGCQPVKLAMKPVKMAINPFGM